MISTTYYLSVLFIFLRMLSFFVIVPIFFPKGTPNAVKIAFAGIMGIILVPAVHGTTVQVSSGMSLILPCINEVVTGLLLGYMTNLVFFCIQMAGQLIDMQMGLSMITMFDPTSNSNTTLIEHIFYWLALVTYFTVDGHHMLIRALTESFNIIHLGSSFLTQDIIMQVMKVFIDFFALGLKIALPIVLIVLLTDLTMGLVARTVPQLNIMILGLPVKLLVGITAITLSLPIITQLMVSTFSHGFEAISHFYKVLPVLLVFASEDKTEEATPKKKSDARKKGQVAKSKEVNLALTLIAITLIIVILAGYVANNFKQLMIYFLGSYMNTTLDYSSLRGLFLIVLWRVAATFLPVVVPIMVFGIAANYLQTGFLFTWEPLMPKLSKINPISGFKKMFSMRTLVELFKDLAMVGVVGYVGYKFIMDNYQYILSFSDRSLDYIPILFKNLVTSIFFKITMIMVIIALADYIYQWRSYTKELRMTKQEIKEEFKQQEGDPQIKSKIRQKQREMATRRMMQQVPKATVVVTNPTHIAVALRYEEGESAPTLIAKGTDLIALKIKEVAKENEIPIVENKPLARLIYQEVELDQEIPADMYQAVAEILAFVYKLKKRK